MSGRLALGALALILTGCGAPELDLVFEIPAPYGDLTNEVVLRIYEPRGASAFGCDALAFGEVEAGVLRGSLVEESRLVNVAEAPLFDIDRTSPKLFFAEARDDEGRAVARGCTDLGALEADAEVRIVGQAVAEVGLIDAPGLSKSIGEALSGPIILRVTDTRGAPRSGAAILWRLEGAGGVASEGEAVTDGLGEVGIRPALPARPGPFALRVRHRWAEPVGALATGFVAPAPEVLTLSGRVLEYRVGRIGPAAERGFVALLDSGTDLRVAFVYRDASGNLVERVSQSVSGSGARLGVFDFRGGDVRDPVVVVSRDAWIEVSPDGRLQPKSYRPPVAATGALPRRVLASGPCLANPDSPQVLVSYVGANAVGFFDLEGSLVGGFSQNLDVLASGCVDDQDGGPIRTLVIDGGDAVGLLLAAEVDTNLYVTLPWVAVGSGAAFSPPVGEDGRLLLGTQLNVNDFVVSRASWRRQGESVELTMRGLDSPPEIPAVNQAGDIDGDGALDVVSLFARRPVPGNPARWSLWGVLGRGAASLRMAGTFDLGAAPRSNPTLMLLDLDGDAVDDLVVAERQDPAAPAQSETRIEIYSMGLVVE